MVLLGKAVPVFDNVTNQNQPAKMADSYSGLDNVGNDQAVRLTIIRGT
jgi:hypothetical protein